MTGIKAERDSADERFRLEFAKFIAQYGPQDRHENALFVSRLHDLMARHTLAMLRPFQDAAAASLAQAPMPTLSIRTSDL